MSDIRLGLAIRDRVLADLPDEMVVLGPADPEALSAFAGMRLSCVQRSYRLTQAYQAQGHTVIETLPDHQSCVFVSVPRSKSDARDLIAQAIGCAPAGRVIVDGQKTDGIDSLSKALVKAGANIQSFSKAHGKTIWFDAASVAHVANEWRAPAPAIDGDWVTAAGVFSADGVDPASALLVESLPKLSGTGADIGAGWGYLAREVLRRNPGLDAITLVEDDAIALDCARQNVTDPRATFVWADALGWTAGKRLDWVVMNPPFHVGRSADASLGQSFIRAAARVLRPGGRLFMVANAHLPYAGTLDEIFGAVETLAKTTRFRVTCAEARRTR